MITGEQVKAARRLLGWTTVRLAGRSNQSESALVRLEAGERRPLEHKVLEIRETLEAAGVEFTNGGERGVKLKAKPRTIEAGDLNASNDE